MTPLVCGVVGGGVVSLYLVNQIMRCLIFLVGLYESTEIPAIPPDTYWVPASNKRRIRATKFSDYQPQNTVYSTNKLQ